MKAFNRNSKPTSKNVASTQIWHYSSQVCASSFLAQENMLMKVYVGKDYAEWKEQREYLNWLHGVHKFIEA